MAMGMKIGGLLVMLMFFASFTSVVVVANDVPGDINWWCSKTPNPEACIEFLNNGGRQSFVSTNKSGFREMAIQVIVERASALINPGPECHNEKENMAWADCLELYENTIMQLNQIGECSDVDAQTWLSTALTNLETCRAGFVELGVSDFLVQLPSSNVSTFLCDLLAINNVPYQQDKYDGGYPSWMVASDRKLLGGLAPGLKANLVVAQDGSGNFATIKEAIDAIESHRRGSRRFVIYVKAGVYRENIQIGPFTKNIMLVGDGMRKTIITGSRSVGGGYTSFNSATVAVTGEGFIAGGITFRNTAGPQYYQAVAFRSSSDLSAFYHCSFEGYQDTLYVHSQRQFYRECYIYGTVDFIFGNAAVIFQNCMIYARKPIYGQQNVITAQGRIDPNQNTGITIHNSRIMASADLVPMLGSVKTYLGRPWQQYSRTVFLQTYMESLVDGAGWLEWDGDFAVNTLYYGEYRNMGPGSATERRVRWSGFRVIKNPSEAARFSVGNFLAGHTWLPATGFPFTTGI